MLRTLLVLAIPFTTLLASLPPVAGSANPGAANQLDLAQIPIAEDTAKQGASELTKVRTSAEEGDLEAMARLGVMYYWGEGAPMDWDKAKVWLRKASERGHADAQAKLGAMCFLGQGGPRDLDESLKWFRAAAEQGEPYAEGCMGVMYAVGEGVPKDLVLADFWLTLARDGGDTDAAEPLAQVEAHLTKDQLKDAKERLANRTVVKTETAN